jgi:hypothetical protein
MNTRNRNKTQTTHKRKLTCKRKHTPIKIGRRRQYGGSKLIKQVNNFNMKQKDKYIMEIKDNTTITDTRYENLITITNLTGTICGKLYIEQSNKIYLDELNKCGNYSGTEVIKVIETFAKENNYIQISLFDQSRIIPANGSWRCYISLAPLHILSTGNTWYNKLGYVSENYSKELAHHTQMIKKPFINFLHEMNNKYKNHNHIFDENLTIQEVFSEILIILKNHNPIDCNDTELKWVFDLLDLVNNAGYTYVNNIDDIKKTDLLIGYNNIFDYPLIKNI